MLKVLIVAYFYSPYQGVGAKRASYWGKYMEMVAPEIECTVLTGTKQEKIDSSQKVIYLESKENHSIFNRFIKDDGYKWLSSLKEYFLFLNKTKYDVVIITGGPFFHFSIARLLKKIMNCKIILDFRDPFSKNPRYRKENNIIIKIIKRLLEYRYVRLADVVITVNDFCKQLIAGNQKYHRKFFIIDNGFDDILVNHVKSLEVLPSKGKLKIVYAGTFYKDVDPKKLFNVLQKDEFNSKIELIHVGKNDKYTDTDSIKFVGFKPYLETLQHIYSSDVGLILTGGEEFESTTKIFDYLAFNKTILIITEGEKNTGNISRILRDVPNIYWSKNNEDDISQTLALILKNEYNNEEINNPERFSRRFGLIKLTEIINSL